RYTVRPRVACHGHPRRSRAHDDDRVTPGHGSPPAPPVSETTYDQMSVNPTVSPFRPYLPHTPAHGTRSKPTRRRGVAGGPLPAPGIHDPARASNRGGDLPRRSPREPHHADAVRRARDPRASSGYRPEHPGAAPGPRPLDHGP